MRREKTAFDSVTSSIGELPLHTTTRMRLSACQWSHVAGTMQNSLTLVSTNPSATESTAPYISFSRSRFCHHRVHFGSCLHTSFSLSSRASTPHPSSQVCGSHHQEACVERARSRHQPAYRSAPSQLRGHAAAGNHTPWLFNVCSILVVGVWLWLCVLQLAP